jgi:peptidoglycan/xylan/chitin deacetylase (PgdA/CDA1 family)
MTLKLSPVHAVMRRGVPAAVLLAAFLLALQMADSQSVAAPSTNGLEQALQPIAQVEAAGGPGWDFTRSPRWVIPLGRRSISVPILVYHYIRKPPSILTDRIGYNLSIAPADFQLQTDWLSSHGYHPVDFNDLRAYFDGRRPLPGRPVVITLDDGYQDLYTTAYPILREHSFKAVAYIVSGFVGQARYATASEIQEMAQNGIEIASHTVNHADLVRTSLPWATYQLLSSKAWLQRLVRQPMLDFAYPSGQFDARVVAAVRAAGYDTAVTVIAGNYHGLADRYTWTRVRVSGGESLAEFIRNLGAVEPMVEVVAIVAEVGSP